MGLKGLHPLYFAPNMGGLGRKHVVQACEASLKRLGVETIDLYQLHRFDPATPIEETLEAGPPLPLRDVAQVLVIEREQVPGDEARR